jgi:catechol 2,3-dioxygenase-like lactoylglutathione lyase family enzyme
MANVMELRVALTVQDFDQALAFYRDALGLEQLADWSSGTGRVVALDAGRATLELFDQAQAESVLTPWGDRNARVQAPDGMQLTLFTPE